MASCHENIGKAKSMRIWALSFLLASTAALGLAADKGTFSGKWKVSQSIAGHDNSQSCTFTQEGNDLAGSCGGEQGALKITGKVEDKKITWSTKSEYNGSPLTINYTGTIDAQDKITGTVMVEEFSVEGEFTASREQ